MIKKNELYKDKSIRKLTMTDIIIKYSFPKELKKKCKVGFTNDINYPFLKPFKILFYEGKPVGKINFQVLKLGNECFAFGTLNYSKGNRFIFFPGLADTKVYDTQYKISGGLEHITCDWNLNSFHFKLKTKKERIPDYPVTKIQEGHYYWFTFTLKSPEYLQKVKDFEYQFTVPDTDKERRALEFFASIEEMENKIITLPGKKLNPDEFLNFNFYISLMDCFDEKNIKVLCRFGEPPEGFKIDAKIYEIDLKDTDYKIVMCVSRHRFRSNLGMDKARIYH